MEIFLVVGMVIVAALVAYNIKELWKQNVNPDISKPSYEPIEYRPIMDSELDPEHQDNKKF